MFNLSKIRLFTLYIFIALLGYEYWNKLSVMGGMTVPKLAGIVYFGLAMLTPKKMLSINKENILLLGVLFFLWAWLLFTSLITHVIYDSELVLQLTFIQLIFLFWLILNEIKYNSDVRDGIRFAFILGVFSIYILMSQGVGVQSSRESETVEDIESVTRIWFMGLNPNSLGNLSALAFILALSFFSEIKNKAVFLLVIPMLSFVTMIMQSGSAGALLLLFLGVSLFFITQNPKGHKKTIYYASAVILMFILFNFFSSSEYIFNKLNAFFLSGETSGRIGIWKENISLTSKNPFIGVGHVYRTAHNVFLDMFKWGGIVAFTLFTAFIFIVLKKSFRDLIYNKNFLPLILSASASFILLKSGGGLNLKYIWIILALAAASTTSFNYNEKNNISSQHHLQRRCRSRLRQHC